MGRPSILQKRGWRNICLCERPHFLATSWTGAASPCHTSSELPEPSVNTPALLCAKVCKKGRPQLSWIKHQTSSTMHCFPHSSPFFQETKAASVYPHPHHTVKKPWASVSTSKAALAAVLEMEPDNFGYEWLVCSSGWNYRWRRRSAGSLAEWGHWRAARAQGWKKGFLAVLCPCGETTSKRSRASHFWVSPQMLFEKVPAAANWDDGGFRAVSTSNWNQGNLWDLVL